ncbi:MAG: hypothetical protein H0S85_09065 [Desulfovibrionaceae bacterium]|jgi:dienelactone hydrolase|nr:hypothetical protein [Desulfovibrionaceae bacterium]
MRLAGWLFSFALHAGVILYLLLGPDVFPAHVPDSEVYMVELAEAPAPKPEPAPEPKIVEPEPAPPAPCPPAAPPKKAAPPPPRAPEAPQPAPEPRQAAEAQPTGPMAVAPAPEPGVTHISPRKLPRAPDGHVPPQPPVAPNATITNVIVLNNEDKDMLKRGAELRFNLRRLAADDFELADFVGHYRLQGDRYLSVMDGRQRHGGMVIHDSATNIVRNLSKTGAMIFTYGPRLDADAPVIGSVTFFPVKHRETYQDSEKPGHLMWMPDAPPQMHWGTRMRFDERIIHVGAFGTRLDAALVLPPGPGPWPGVVWINGPKCEDVGLLLGFARVLADRGYAVLVPEHRQCATGKPVSRAEAAGDVGSALRTLQRLPTVDGTRIGFWGHGAGAAIALAAALRFDPAFLVCDTAPVPGEAPPEPPEAEDLRALRAPLLWLAAGPDASPAGLRQALENAQAAGAPVRALTLPVAAAGTAGWLGTVSTACGGAALPWLLEHAPPPTRPEP